MKNVRMAVAVIREGVGFRRFGFEYGSNYFIDYAGSWEYPGQWYPGGSFVTTGEYRIENLIYEGLSRIKLGRKGKFASNLYEF